MKVHILDKKTTEEIGRFEDTKSFENFVSRIAGKRVKGFYRCAKVYHNYFEGTLCIMPLLLKQAKDRLRANRGK